MQRTSTCTTCGAGLLPEGKFCRSCGQPVKQVNPSSVTEGTTRLLETPEPKAPFGQEFYEHHGGLAQATSHIPPQAATTSRSLEPVRQSNNWVLVSAITVAFLAILALVIVTLRNRPATTVTLPPPPPAVAGPDIPSRPVPPRGLPQGGVIGREFIYPGSDTTMEINSATEGKVVQLHTTDTFDRVVAWYMEIIRPTNTVKMKGTSVILESERMTVLINAVDDGANIMITESKGD